MAEMEELSKQCGRFCWRWKDSNTKQRKKMSERWRWPWTWPRRSSESVSPWCGLGQRTSASQGKSYECFVGTSSSRGEFSSKDVWRSRSRPFWRSCQAPKWSCSLLRMVLQDAQSEVTKIYPPLKLRDSVDDITALLMEKNQEVAEMAKKK